MRYAIKDLNELSSKLMFDYLHNNVVPALLKNIKADTVILARPQHTVLPHCLTTDSDTSRERKLWAFTFRSPGFGWTEVRP